MVPVSQSTYSIMYSLFTMKVQSALLLLTCAVVSTNAFEVAESSRRYVLRQAFSGAVASVLVMGAAEPALAMAACPPRSQNCLTTTWTAPAGSKKVADTVLEILNGYPQQGQSDVDKGGWTIVESNNSGGGATIRVEYKSGIGNFAKYFNGGKPFVDDLEAQVDGNTVKIRSASRVGDSDFGVNQKRVQFFATNARALGWEAPDPKY